MMCVGFGRTGVGIGVQGWCRGFGPAIDEAYDRQDRYASWVGYERGGGPALQQLALEGDSEALSFSVPMRKHQKCNFSYARLKNQVRLAIAAKNISAEVPLSENDKEERCLRADLAASFQRVAVLHLDDRCRRALEWACKIDPSVACLVVPGAVASNQVVCSRLNYITQELHSDQSTPNQYQKYRKFVSESGIAAEELITEPASGSSKSSCRTSC